MSKAKFYLITGEDGQSHFGLVNRFAHEKSSYLLDIDNSQIPICRPLIIPVEIFGEFEHLQIRFLGELFKKLKVHNDGPLLDKNLSYVSRESRITEKLTANDFVYILFEIHENELNEKAPKLIHWFASEFCGESLTIDAPNFLFYFGVFYDELKPEIETSIQEVVANSGYLKALPTLEMVTKIDIERWFRKYKMIASNKKERLTLLNKYFPNEEYYMDDVEFELENIIRNYNHPAQF